MALKISVIVCAHNEARYLSACLHSLLAQSRLPDEILVINNASTDETRAVTGRAKLAYQGWKWPSSTAYTGLAEYRRVRQEFPEPYASANDVSSRGTGSAAPLDDSGMRDASVRVARDVDRAPAGDRQRVRHVMQLLSCGAHRRANHV